MFNNGLLMCESCVCSVSPLCVSNIVIIVQIMRLRIFYSDHTQSDTIVAMFVLITFERIGDCVYMIHVVGVGGICDEIQDTWSIMQHMWTRTSLVWVNIISRTHCETVVYSDALIALL